MYELSFIFIPYCIWYLAFKPLELHLNHLEQKQYWCSYLSIEFIAKYFNLYSTSKFLITSTILNLKRSRLGTSTSSGWVCWRWPFSGSFGWTTFATSKFWSNFAQIFISKENINFSERRWEFCLCLVILKKSF